jgi:serine protease Do
MTAGDAPARAGRLSEELALLAEHVARSVVAVRNARYGAGSGVVWDRQGLVVTNSHVVTGEHAEVVLADGTPLPARVAARAERLDLAALRVDGAWPATGWAPATIGDSSRLRVGELVVAVGNPLGERNAVTLGVVSGLGAASPLGAPSEALQLAISLRPGNSGGALADTRGRVVGIPHLVTGRGLAVAVPSHLVERFLLGGPRDWPGPASGLVWV